MKASEFSRFVADMLEAEKEVFLEMLENDDFEGIESEAYEYVMNCDND